MLKRLGAALRGHLLRRFGLTLPPIVGELPADLPLLEVRSQRADLVFLLADESLLHLEFQSTSTDDDLRRFCSYNLALYLHHGQTVWTVVFYGGRVASAPTTLSAGSLTFTVQNVYVGQEDGTAMLQALQAKVRAGVTLSEEDRAGLLLWPLMRQEAPLAAALPELREVIGGLPQEQQAPTVGALLALAWRYVDDEWAHSLMEMLNMPNALETMLDDAVLRGLQQGLHQGLEQGLHQGLEQGRLEARRDDVREVLRARFTTIPATLEQRISDADAETLSALLRRAVVAPQVDDM